MSTAKDYKNIQISGPISVVPVKPEDLKGKNFQVFILMGPTGSGKSAFIESLSLDGSLSISKDSLESVTQEATCYQVVNLNARPHDGLGHLVYENILMDTPGFLDTKLSESRIASMILDQKHSLRRMSSWSLYVHICYFQPITDVRLGASKRGAIKLSGDLARYTGAQHIHVITTMWNHISTSKQMVEANRRFDSLEADIFSSRVRNISLTKFALTRESTLDFIDLSIGKGNRDDCVDINKCYPLYQSIHRDNLLERITSSYQQLQFLADEKKNATVPGREDHLLLQVIHRDEHSVQKALQDFLDDLFEIDPTCASSPLPRLPLMLSMKIRYGRYKARFKRVYANRHIS